MKHQYDTWELAKAYETQGYYQDALDILVRLNRRNEGGDKEVLAACNRLEKILEKNTVPDDDTLPDDGTLPEFSKDTRLELMAQEWLRLWAIKYRKAALDNLILHVRSIR